MHSFINIFKSNRPFFLIAGIALSCNFIYEYISKKNNKKLSYTYQEIAKHNKQNDIWVTYKNSVYNITDFIDNHPGGKDKIMLAAGKGIDRYWDIYKQHTNDPDIVHDVLEPMKIGTIKNYDINKYKNEKDIYLNDPKRDPELKFHSVSSCNAETPVNNIMDNWITPNKLWYIRNHHPVPDINPEDYKLEIIDMNNNKFSITLKYIKNMPSKKVTTTIQCGGNRRTCLFCFANEIDKTFGTPWDIGTIGTAEWKGISIHCILTNIKNKDKIKHVQFESIDGVKVSIPINKVLNPNGDVILAYEMNGEELPRDHGYPLRVIVPGYVGIRNIKWLKSIKFSEKEVDSTWQTGLSYKMLPPYIKDIKNIPTIQEIPVQSYIVDYEIKDKKIVIKGFALGGGGRNIIRVDVSTNNGKTWYLANLNKGSDQEINKAWAWTFWEIELNDKDITTLCCKATDNAYNSQPEYLDIISNIRGLNNNSWHRIKINYKDINFRDHYFRTSYF